MFNSLMGDFDDELLGSHMWPARDMNNMMNSLFSDPFVMMGQNALMPHRTMPQRGYRGNMQMTPFGFPPMPSFNIGGMFDMGNMVTAPAGGSSHSFMSQSVMTMSSGPDGRPQVYQETMSTRTAPGGIKETKQTVSDSRTGTKKMAIGHHIGERAHILERERNLRNGDEEERQEFINLEEEEADTFNREWESRTRRGHGAIANASSATGANHSRRTEPRQLALPPTTDPSASRHSSRSRWIHSPRRAIRALNSSKIQSSSSSRSKPSHPTASSNIKSASASSLGTRKHEHKPYSKINNKRHTTSNSNN